MRLQADNLHKVKNYIHAGQAVVLFLAWLLTIAIFTREGSSDGRVGWYFALCWLTVPILIYLVMVPMWSRARRFSNVYAFAALDGLSIIFWLSAWASVASYIAQGKGKGTSTKGSGCDNFEYGSPGRCKLSEGITVLGVFIMVAFIATTFISFKSVMDFKRTGTMPTAIGGTSNDFSVQTQDAFSSNMRNDDFDDDHETDPRQGGYHYQKPSVDEHYAPIYQNEDLSQVPPTLPGGPLSYQGTGLGLHNYDTSYGGANGKTEVGYGSYGR